MSPHNCHMTSCIFFLTGLLVIKLFFDYSFENLMFSLKELNKRMDKFDYGYSELKDKPAPIKDVNLQFQSSTNMGQSASQMWQLVNMLPFIVEDKVGIDDPHWGCFLLLFEIIGICFAHGVSFSSIINLKQLVKDYLYSFKSLYPNSNIIPKQHYLVHLPTQMMRFGPLIRSWCMRFEAKHSLFKDLARRNKFLKNLPFSLAHRHQSMQSAEAIEIDTENNDPPCDNFFEDLHFGRGELIGENVAQHAIATVNRFYDTVTSQDDMLQIVYQYNSVIVHGTQYKIGLKNFIVIELDDNGLPVFGKLTKIWYFSDHQTLFLAVIAMETEFYSEKLNAFKISESGNAQGLIVISHIDFLDYQVHCIP